MRVLLERYELVAPIASSGMGQLWEGTDRRLNRKIVVKLIRHVADRYRRDALRRFYREARITARLGHPGVPQLYDFGTDSGELFMVMEHVAGMTLADLIAEVVPIPIPWAAAIGAQICAVLACAHAQSLVHRDIKPSNVMVGPDGSVKVLDFGIAAGLTPGEFSQITRSGEMPGTASYMAPEVTEGNPAEPASDLYSVGCLLYEMVTGGRVFADPHPVAEIEGHLTRQPDTLRSARPEAPAELDGLVLELLAKTPSERPRDASEVCSRLVPFVTDLFSLPGAVTVPANPNPSQLYAIVQARIADGHDSAVR